MEGVPVSARTRDQLDRKRSDYPAFDTSSFDCSPYSFKVDKPWGWELIWTPSGLPYTGKLLHIFPEKRLSLQLHDAKLESWLLLTGRAWLWLQDSTGEVAKIEMAAGVGYSCTIGQIHRFEAITECEIAEVSTPESGTTWRLEDDFGRDNETPQDRSARRDPGASM